MPDRKKVEEGKEITTHIWCQRRQVGSKSTKLNFPYRERGHVFEKSRKRLGFFLPIGTYVDTQGTVKILQIEFASLCSPYLTRSTSMGERVEGSGVKGSKGNGET